jgi:hypothetical protein
MATPPRKRPPHLQPADAPTDADASKPAEAEAAAAQAPVVDARDIAPLWDFRDEDGRFLLRSDLETTRVYRIVPDPGARPPFKKVMVLTLGPTATIEDIARQCGGGNYLLQATRGGASIAQEKIEIQGEPIYSNIAPGTPAPSAPAAPQPIMETASGLAGIEGLPPWVQLMFAMQQQYTAQLREDSWKYNDRLTSIFQALVGRPQTSYMNDALEMFQAQARQNAEEAQRLRNTLEAERQRLSQTQLRSAVADASSGHGPAQVLMGLAVEHAPQLIELLKSLATSGAQGGAQGGAPALGAGKGG